MSNGKSTAVEQSSIVDAGRSTLSANKRSSNTMETDDSFRMNHSPEGLIYSAEKACSLSVRKRKPISISMSNGSVDKPKNANDKVNDNDQNQSSSRTVLAKSLIKRQLRNANSIIAIKLKTLFLLTNLLLLTVHFAQAGFWTFYFPNFLKPYGYKELTKMIDKVQNDMNVTKDTFADIHYFWTLMSEMDNVDTSLMYPEESVCSEVFPIFRDLAKDYSVDDYEFFMNPMQQYYNHLIEFRSMHYPEGPKSKTILPRELEQRLYEKEIEFKIFWLTKLANGPDYRKKREKMVTLWRSVKRSLDTSLPCVYLRYSFRQVAEDINQLALDMNLQAMSKALEMIQAAFKRIDKFKGSDQEAMKQIEEAIMREERFRIRP